LSSGNKTHKFHMEKLGNPWAKLPKTPDTNLVKSYKLQIRMVFHHIPKLLDIKENIGKPLHPI